MSDEKVIDGEIVPPGESTAIVRREPTDIFAHFDKLDDEAIVAELEGRLTEIAVYHFPQDGKELWGLSKVGVDWAVNQLGKEGYAIRDESLTYTVDPTDPSRVLFTALVGKYYVAKDGQEAKVDAAIGNKGQSVKIRKRDGTTIPDPFWFEKGGQKALRNARLRLIPEATKAMIMAKAKELGKVKDVKDSDVWQGRKTEGGQQAGTVSRYSRNSASSPSPAPSTSKFDLLDKFKEARKALGDSDYYAVLGQFGYEHANDVPQDRRKAVLDTMRQLLKDRRSAK